jgi:hypothetical protein
MSAIPATFRAFVIEQAGAAVNCGVRSFARASRLGHSHSRGADPAAHDGARDGRLHRRALCFVCSGLSPGDQSAPDR